MLYYKNNRFYIGGMSFALPENIYVVTDFERTTANGFADNFLNKLRKRDFPDIMNQQMLASSRAYPA